MICFSLHKLFPTGPVLQSCCYSSDVSITNIQMSSVHLSHHFRHLQLGYHIPLSRSWMRLIFSVFQIIKGNIHSKNLFLRTRVLLKRFSCAFFPVHYNINLFKSKAIPCISYRHNLQFLSRSLPFISHILFITLISTPTDCIEWHSCHVLDEIYWTKVIVK